MQRTAALFNVVGGLTCHSPVVRVRRPVAFKGGVVTGGCRRGGCPPTVGRGRLPTLPNAALQKERRILWIQPRVVIHISGVRRSGGRRRHVVLPGIGCGSVQQRRVGVRVGGGCSVKVCGVMTGGQCGVTGRQRRERVC